MIAGVTVTPLKRIDGERGRVLHMLRSDEPAFRGFGEIYFSTLFAQCTKGWTRHMSMVSSLCVVRGRVRLAVFDDRAESPTSGAFITEDIGDDNYCLVQVEPRLWVAFANLGEGEAIVANCASQPHDDAETDRRALDDDRMPTLDVSR